MFVPSRFDPATWKTWETGASWSGVVLLLVAGERHSLHSRTEDCKGSGVADGDPKRWEPVLTELAVLVKGVVVTRLEVGEPSPTSALGMVGPKVGSSKGIMVGGGTTFSTFDSVVSCSSAARTVGERDGAKPSILRLTGGCKGGVVTAGLASWIS